MPLKNIFSVLFCVVILSQAQVVEPNAKTDLQLKNERSWGEKLGGLRCRIETTRKRYFVDNPISFRITFENTGEQTIHLRGMRESRLYEAGTFYFNDQKVILYDRMDSYVKVLTALGPSHSKVFLCTLWPRDTKIDKIPQTPGQYKVRFHYRGADILDLDKSDGGLIKSSPSLGEVVSNIVKIKIAEQPDLTDPGVETKSLEEILEKLREEIDRDCYILDTIIRGVVAQEAKKYKFILMHNPQTSKQGRKEAAQFVKWNLGGQVVAENDEYLLLAPELTSDTENQEELIKKICALLSLEMNNIRKDMKHYLREETKYVAREMDGQMVLTLKPSIMLKEIGNWRQELSIEELQKFIQDYPEERDWHAFMHERVAWSLQKKGEWEKAIEIYQKTIDEYGELPHPLPRGDGILVKDMTQRSMAKCYLQMGNNEEALAILDNLRSQTKSRMIRQGAEHEYTELYNEVSNQSK